MQTSGGLCAGLVDVAQGRSCRGSVSPISPARAIEDARCQSNRSSTRRHGRGNGAHWAHPRRASDGFDWNASDRRKRVRHASFIATNPLQRKTARARTRKSISSAGRFEKKARGPTDDGKRRSGIVRRPAAPDSASAASERCRGRKPQERRLTKKTRGRRCRSTHVRISRTTAVGPVVRKTKRVALVVLCVRRLIRRSRAVASV